MKRYRTALVLGLGVSGVAASRLLLREGTHVTAIDGAKNAVLVKVGRKLRAAGAEVHLGCKVLPGTSGMAGKALREFDVCIVSPGIRADSKWVTEIRRRGVEAISELEFGASRCKCPMLAITGSKGKSTMVKLCGDALKLSGQRVELAGNYGYPISDVAMRSGRLDWIVVEVSSFQMELAKDFHPGVGLILNIQPDHLDRHGDMKTYVSLKARIFARMGRGDCGVVLDKNKKLIASVSEGRNRWLTFGTSPGASYRYRDGKVEFRDSGRRVSLDFGGTIFANGILGVAVAGAVACIRAVGIAPKFIVKAAREFKPLPHRMNHVATIRGVKFINDSKATSLTALQAGIRMCDSPVRLIAGGLLKEKDMALPEKELATRVRRVYLIGQSSVVMMRAWRRVADCVACGTLEKAVQEAFGDAASGDTVLLSPGCASFDQFRNFEDRGEKFAKWVNRLRHEE